MCRRPVTAGVDFGVLFKEEGDEETAGDEEEEEWVRQKKSGHRTTSRFLRV